MKVVIWLVVLAAIIVWAQRFLRRILGNVVVSGVAPSARTGIPGQPQSSPRPAAVEHMVQCRVCGVHVPGSEAVSDLAGHSFCSTEHRSLQA